MSKSFRGFRSLVENNPDPTSVVDRRGQILYASAAARIFGYRPEELVGRQSLKLIHSEDRARVAKAMRELVAGTGNSIRWQARIRHNDGSWSWVESVACNMLFDAEVGAIAISHRSIDDRMAMEAKVKQNAEEIVRANLNLEEFAYTVAHDLREPLRTMSAFTELLILTKDMDEKTKQVAGFAVDAAARMNVLLCDLLSLASAVRSEPPGRVELETAAAEAAQNLGHAIGASGAVVAIGRLPAVCGAEGHFVRVFQNLIGNAVKYRGKAIPDIRVTAERRGSEWVIQVSDNGVGIPANQHRRIFELSTRLHGREIPGTGIGLAVCKKLVEGAGGRIWVESGPGPGSSFYFTVREADEKPPSFSHADLFTSGRLLRFEESQIDPQRPSDLLAS